MAPRRSSLRVSGSPVRTLVKSTSFHPFNEGANNVSTPKGLQKCDLSRRLLSHKPPVAGTFENVGDCLASGNAGLSNQLEGVISPSVPPGGVLGVRSRHLSVDDIPASGKNQQNLAVVHRSGTEKTVLPAVPIILYRKVTKCLYSHSARSPSFSPYANDKYKGPGEIFSQLRGLCRPPRECPGGTEMVVTQPKTLEREILCESESGIRCCHHDGCKQNGLGSPLPGSDHSEPMVKYRTRSAHQCPGAQSSRSCHPSFHSEVASAENSCCYGQHDCCVTDYEDGVNKVILVPSSDSGDLGVCTVSQEHNYCSVPPRETKRISRLPEQGFPRQQQLDDVPINFSSPAGTVSKHPGGYVCGQVKHSASKVLELETRPVRRRSGCIDRSLEGDECLRLPSIQTHSSNSKEVGVRENVYSSYRTSLTKPAVASDSVEDVNRTTSSATATGSPAHSSRRVNPSDVQRTKNGSGSLASIRGPGSNSVLSGRARALADMARSSGTNKAYDSGCRKFTRWCSGQQVDPFSCCVELVANFLAEQQELVSFSTLAGYRTAISHFHCKVDGTSVGKHSLVNEVMWGAFRDNPPVPKCANTWDVNQVLSYLQELGPNAGLTQKVLTLKLAMLLALVCRARGHELRTINPQALPWYEDNVVCHILEMTKTKSMSKPKKSFELLKYNHSSNLDPIACLKAYLIVTASQRESEDQKSHLFLSYVSPHQVVKSCSIARWLKLVMEESGIDMNKFKAHSTRAAATSRVPLVGMTPDDIAKLGDWSNVTTFYKFYKKDFQSASKESYIQSSILKL